jgi:uncharacterized protein (TIGR00369 family)
VALRRLHNEDWGFESSCFVCEPRNDRGLQLPFHHDTDREVVVCEFTLGNEFSGAPSYVHGGITLAILDEAMAWATIAVGGKFAVTTETTTRFLRPTRVGRSYTVEARVESQDDERIRTTATVLDDRQRACAESDATFAILSPAVARDAIGTEVTGDAARYLKGDDG